MRASELKATIARASFAPSSLARRRIECLTSSRRFCSFIEPEVSTTKVMRSGLRSSLAISLPRTTTRSMDRTLSVLNRLGVRSVWIAKMPSVGAATSALK
jgi:hypothetical protein